MERLNKLPKVLIAVVISLVAWGSYTSVKNVVKQADKCVADIEKKPEPKPDTVVDGPTAVITDGSGGVPADTVDIGDNVILKSDKSITGSSPKSRNWWIDPPYYMQRASLLENDTTVSIPVGRKEGQVKVILMTAKADKVAFKTFMFTVKDLSEPEPTPVVIPVKPVPVPVVPPVPEPKPVPVVVPVPVPVDALAGFKTGIDSLLIPQASDDEIRIVAEAFKKVAKQINDNTISTTSAMTGNTADEMKEGLGLNGVLPWLKWRDGVLDHIKALDLKSFKDHAKYWSAVGDVLLTKVKGKVP